VTEAELWGAGGNKSGLGIVGGRSGRRRFEKQLNPKDHPMTIKTCIGLGLSAVLVSLGLAFAPATFAQDKMGKDDGMKKESMSKDAMKKDDGMMKKDGMKHDGMMKEGMKKDDGMKKN
jgi:pentapeptide MXKDX repeat protein